MKISAEASKKLETYSQQALAQRMLPVTPMFSLCTPLKYFLLPVVLSFMPVGVTQAQTLPAQPANTPVTEKEKEAQRKEDERQPVLRVLPDGLDPNPPAPDDLKADKLTWKGEYEATRDGQPVLGPDARPIPVLYNAKGRRVKSKIKPLHAHQLEVVAGTLTVDGWTGKARLNYDIPGQDFMYFSTPTFGTVILSQTAFPGSREQKFALDGKTLTIHVNDHEVQLASDKVLAGRKPESIWMRLDSDYHQDPRYPVMGFGTVTKPPYAWPGAKLATIKGTTSAPPLPANMMPTMITPACISQAGKLCGPVVKPTPAQKPPASSAKASPALQ